MTSEPQVGPSVSKRIRIVRLIQEGAQSRVYLGRHAILPRGFAVKVFLDQRDDVESIKRFLRDAQAQSRIAHGNIPTLSEFGRTEDGCPYIALELCEGPTLASLLEGDTPLTPKRALGLLSQLASGLVAAHDAGVSHGRLDATHVILVTSRDESEIVKLIGIAPPELAQFEEDRQALARLIAAALPKGEGASALHALASEQHPDPRLAIKEAERELARLSAGPRRADAPAGRRDESTNGGRSELAWLDEIGPERLNKEELGTALHALRGQHRRGMLSLLSGAFDEARVPAQVRSTLAQIARLEAEVEDAQISSALMQSEIDENEHSALEREGRLRNAIVELAVERTVARERLKALYSRDREAVEGWKGRTDALAPGVPDVTARIRAISDDDMKVLDELDHQIASLEKRLHEVAQEGRSGIVERQKTLANREHTRLTTETELDRCFRMLGETIAAQAAPAGTVSQEHDTLAELGVRVDWLAALLAKR